LVFDLLPTKGDLYSKKREQEENMPSKGKLIFYATYARHFSKEPLLVGKYNKVTHATNIKFTCFKQYILST
jgi:hypothetical protein